MFGVYGPCGTHSIWCRPFSRGLTSSGMATSGTFHVALRVGPATLRPSEGCIAEVNTVAAAQAEVVPCDSVVPSSCRGPLSAFSAPPWGFVLVCLSLGASFSFFFFFFLSPLPFSF